MKVVIARVDIKGESASAASIEGFNRFPLKPDKTGCLPSAGMAVDQHRLTNRRKIRNGPAATFAHGILSHHSGSQLLPDGQS